MNSMMLAPGTRDGNWMWDGGSWVCAPDCGQPPSGQPVPCPPFGPPVFSGPTQQPPWYPGANGGVSFGAVAPANPVRGHMWWDGTTFWLFDGAAWVAISADGGTTPSPGPGPVTTTSKVFEISTNTASAVAANTYLIAPINGAPTANTMGAWDVNNHTYTPNKPGVYNFEIGAYNPTTTLMEIYLVKNDTGVPLDLTGSTFLAIAANSAGGWANANGMAQMNGTTDFIRIWTSFNTATNWFATNIPNLRGFALP